MLYPSYATDLILFNGNPLPCFILEKASLKISAVNESASSFYGYTQAILADFNFFNLMVQESRIRLRQKFQTKTDNQPWKEIVQQYKKNGQLVTVEMHVSPVTIENEKLLQISIIDITEKLAAQETLGTANERYRAYIEQSSEGIFCQEFAQPIPINISVEEMIVHLKRDGYLSECNDAMAKMYGFKHASDIIGALAEQLIDFNDPANIKYLEEFIHNGFRIIDAESHEIDKDGTTRYFLNNLIGTVEDGYLKRVWGTQRDITERKKIEEKIGLLASLVEETTDVLTAADLEFKPITWNKAAEKTYGLTADQVIGKNLREYLDLHYPNTTKEEVRNIIKEKGEWRGEMYFFRPTDRKVITLLVTFKLLNDENGRPLLYVIAATNITERKEAELKLLESESRFQIAADTAPIGIWMTDADGELMFISKTLLDFSGLGGVDYKDVHWSTLVHPEDYEKTSAKYKQCVANRLPVTLIYRLKKGEQYSWVQDSSTPRLLRNGSFLGYIGSVINIDEIKTKDDNLRYQATVLENVLDMIVTTDLKLVVKSWNRIAEQVYGYKEQEAIGKNFGKLVQYELLNTSCKQAMQHLADNGIWKGEAVYKKEGKTNYFMHTLTHVYNEQGEKIGIMAVGRDITDRKLAEVKLKQSEEFYRSLIAHSNDGMLLMNEFGIIGFASPSIKNILGYSVDELTGNNGFDFIHKEDHNRVSASMQRDEAGPQIKSFVIRFLKKSGEWLWCMVRSNNLLDNPAVNSIVIHFHDDTLRKKASDALMESERRFRTLIKDLQVGVLLQNTHGKILMSNNAMCEMLNVSQETLTGNQVWNLYADMLKEDGTLLQEDETPWYRAIHTKKVVQNVVIGLLGSDTDERLWLILNAAPMLDGEGNVTNIVCSFTNITERKKLEQKLIQKQIHQQKLLTQATIDGQEKERKEIGKELHDNIGQQLTTTKLYLDLAKSSADEATQEMICLALKSISDVINEIRGISRALIPPSLGDLGLIDSIYDVIETINRTKPLSIELDDRGFDEDKIAENQKLMLFRIVQEQLNNILKHANANNVIIKLQNTMPMLSLEIKDDGKGFDTVKTRKGLGLTNIKNRAELFGGKVEIFSSIGAGCTLKVMIPYQLTEIP